jgi:hypothetical protein
MNKIVLSILVFSSTVCFGQQLTNSNFELWTTENYGSEPNNWLYNDGTGLVYGTNNYFRGLDGVDPLTTTKITGSGAFGGSGNSVLLETKAAVGTTLLSNGYTTIPGYLFRQEAITNTNIGSITFNYKSTVVQGDSCSVKVGLIDANNNLITYGEFWIKPSDNSTTWKTKSIVLQNLLPGTPTIILIEAMSTFDESYLYNTPIIGSKLYLDNFTLNYCNSAINTNVSETICAYNLPYTWNGLTFTSAGTQSNSLTSALGCDSIVNMTLNVIPGPFTLIPDVGFETYLGTLGLDPCGIDGKVPTSYIDTLVSLSINSNNVSPAINDLTGIEDFTSLETLNINRQTSSLSNGVYITSPSGLDLSQNTNLKNFVCRGCKLQNLDLSANVNLESLNLGQWSDPPTLPLNNISTLDLTSNTILKYVDASYCSLQNISFPQSSSLLSVFAKNNSISNIDFTSLTNLKRLDLSNNAIINIAGNNNTTFKSLNLQNNPNLISLPTSASNVDSLIVKGCAFSGLNLSTFSNIKFLDCSDNDLECLSIKNNSNTQMGYLNTLNNFTLTCIEVDDSLFSSNNPIWNANKDDWSSYSEDCIGVCVTADISEVNIEKIIIYPNPTNGIINIQSESNIKEITLLDVAGKTLGKFKANSVDLSEFASGTYMLNIRYANDFEVSKQIIKK